MNFCALMVFGIGLGCSGPEKAVAVREYCEVSKPIIASRQDTAKTLEQVRRENAKRRKLCGVKP